MTTKPTVICLMGPTASGKTALAVELVQRFACDIISVDSAMVYRGMDIGTAKPGQEILEVAPHRLIDICDPAEPYSAGQFRDDALREIRDVIANGRTPLLVGGTMMYFRALQQGLAAMPKADPTLRDELTQRATREGWAALHAQLSELDPVAARRINTNDAQRIQRALEVCLTSGKPISSWHQDDSHVLDEFKVINLGLMLHDRAALHERIAIRFNLMLQMGLVDEVSRLYQRGDLTVSLPSVRSVGYRQVWDYLENRINYDEMCFKAIAATRQLAKRQITWLRSWPSIELLDAEAPDLLERASVWLRKLG